MLKYLTFTPYLKSWRASAQVGTVVTANFRWIFIGALVLLLTVAFGDAVPLVRPVRLVLGLAYVLYVPGYCLVAALFPDKGALDTFERLGLSIGLSVAIVPLLALLLSLLPWGLRLWPILLGEDGVTTLFIGIALYRRSQLSAEVDHALELEGWRFREWWQSLQPADRRVSILLAGALLLALASAGWILAIPSPDTFTTEFYVLGNDGLAESYPRVVSPGDEPSATLGIVNRERDEHEYHVETWVEDSRNPNRRVLAMRLDSISLSPGGSGQWSAAWRMPWIGDDQIVEFLLFVDGNAQPYRKLRLWLDVRTPTTTPFVSTSGAPLPLTVPSPEPTERPIGTPR